MDQSRFWIQNEETCFNRPPRVFGDSWEEQAFAEDATGPLGGCIWPPRSYTCSFCRREFRSAQALGGHMNVHRRDRARLKKISTSNNNQVVVETHHTSDFDICVQLPNPNFDHHHPPLLSSSSSSTSVSILRPFTCSFGRQQHQKVEPEKTFHIADFGNQDSSKVLETAIKKNNHNQIELHLASDINSLIRKRCDIDDTPETFSSKKDDASQDHGLIFKKRRIEGGVLQSFLPRNSNLLLNSDEVESVSPGSELTNTTSDNLDLELRLGDRPRSSDVRV